MEALLQTWFSGPLGNALVRLLNMSAAAGVLIVVVVLLRALLRRAPKWTRCILWAIVAVQLVCPVTLRSPLSVYALLPRSNEVQSDQVEVFRAGGGSENPLLMLEPPQIAAYEPGAVTAQAPADPPPQMSVPGGPSIYLPAAGLVWFAGVAVMLLYALVSWLTLRRRVRASVPLEERTMLCDAIETPFLLGVLRPRIYLPSGLDDAQRAAALAHERAHLRRGDHWWKLLGFLLLAVHWFNPLVWLAYVLLCRDIELACDERAVRDMDADARADYSQALLDCAAPRPLVRVCPLAFGEVGIKERIKAVLNYKKPAFWIIVSAVAVCTVVAVCFLTRPGPIRTPEANPAAVTPTPHPTEAPSPLPTWPRLEVFDFEAFHTETAQIYFLDAEYRTDNLASISPFYIILDTESGMFQYYETPVSSYIGIGVFTLDGDILTMDDSYRVNRFRMEDERLIWLAEGSDNFWFVKLTDGATFSLDKTPRTRQMTLDDVRALAQKGEGLTWDDLAPFAGEDIGSGLYVYRYPIDDVYCLEARGGSLEGAPMSVRLLVVDADGVFRDGVGYSIDIRTEDVDAFLARDRSPYLTVTSGGQSVAAYPIILYERRKTDYGWLYGDGVPAASVVMEHPERIPTLTLGSDFSAVFGGGAVRMSGLNVYDEAFSPLRENWYGNAALNWLDPGTYYCDIKVHGPLGRYIEAEDAYEESGYQCIFRLIVTETGPAAFTPGAARGLAKATLRYRGENYVLTDPAALWKLEGWLSGAQELPADTACPFGSLLTLTLADGSEISLCPAEDSCGTVFSDGRYYRYADGNEAFWALFGIPIS